jgi:DNA repair exonuclease SbcCD nuclease subunit
MDKMTLYFYGACLAGILAVTTFLFSVILVPAWNWGSTVPAAIGSSVSGIFGSNSATPKPSPSSRQAAATSAIAPVVTYQEKSAKPADCGQIVKQIKAGKAVNLPQECEQTYQAAKDREQAKLEEQRLKEESRQKELDRAKAERENAQRLELERQRDLDRQREQERQRQEAEQTRAAAAERAQRQQEAEDRRRQEAREESARKDAQRAAEQRERTRQQEVQKRNDAIIKFGTDLKKIFKKNR